MTTATKQEKTPRQDKTQLLMQIGLELKLHRSAEGKPLAEIPNWQDAPGPIPLDSNLCKLWLCYRAFKLHGFVAASGALNAVIRTLSGIAIFEETTPIYTPEPVEEPLNALPKLNEPVRLTARLATSLSNRKPTDGPYISRTIESVLSQV